MAQARSGQYHSGGGGGGGTKSRMPLDKNEQKKLRLLGLLCVVGVAVLAWTFLGNRSPNAAEAATAAGAMQPEVDLSAALAQMQQPPKTSPDKLFATVDDALDIFLDGWKSQSMPAERLRLSAFDLRGTLAANADSATPADASPAATPAASQSGGNAAGRGNASRQTPADEQKDPLILQLQQMRLETVLVSARNKAAIIDGRVVNIGEEVDGFRVTHIEPHRVVVQRDGRAFALVLR